MQALKKLVQSRTISLQVFYLFRFLSAMLISIFLVKIFDDLTIVSVYEELVLLGTLLTFFWISGITSTFLPQYYHSDEESGRKMIFSVFVLMSGLSLLAALLFLAGWKIFFPDLNAQYVYLFSLLTFLNSPTFLTEFILLVKNKKAALYFYGIISFSLRVIVFTGPLYYGYDLTWGIIGLLILSVLKIILLAVLLKKYSLPSFETRLLRSFLMLSLPLMGSILLGKSSEHIDGIIVNHFLGDEIFAIFRYGARELPLLLIVSGVLSIISSGNIAQKYREGNFEDAMFELRKASRIVMGIMGPLMILLIIFSKDIFTYFFNEQFILSAEVFNIYMLLIISRVTFPQSILLGLNQNKYLLIASLTEWILNIILSLLFIRYWGVYGVAWATIIVFFVEKLILMYVCYRKGIKPAAYFPFPEWALMTGGILITYFWVT